MKKTVDSLKSLSRSFIIAGIILLLIGAYYLVIKAGIPYQDPPLELQIQYTVNSRVGDEMLTAGATALIVGVVGRVVTGIICKKYKTDPPS